MRTAKDHRPAILKAAAGLFGQRRFHEVLIEDVAAAAGVAKGTIYRFYRTKEELLAAICLVSLDELACDLERVATRPVSARERLRQMVGNAVRHFRRDSDFFEVMQREWGRACHGKGSPFMTRRAKARKLYANVIRSGQAAGEFRSIPAERAADLLMAMNRGMLCNGDKRLPAARVTGLILDVFLDGMAVSRGKRR
jgi:TetR/AcrR family fatty acid metabolism transcriptional regulator